jgi:hypothetical protein
VRATRAGLVPLAAPAWLQAVEVHPDVACLRADALRTLQAVVWALAADVRQDKDGTTAPTWAVLVTRTGRSRRTVAHWLAWLQERALLFRAEAGSTAATRPASSTIEGNRSAVYLPTRRQTAEEIQAKRRSRRPRRPPTQTPAPSQATAPSRAARTWTGREAVLTVHCPRCYVAPGVPCHRSTGTRVAAHYERHQSAIAHGARPLQRPVRKNCTPPVSLLVEERTVSRERLSNQPPNPHEHTKAPLTTTTERLRREVPESHRGGAGRLSAAVRRRARRLSEDQQAPYLEALLNVRPAGLTHAIRAAGLAGATADQVLHALRFAVDGTQHVQAEAPVDPVAVLVWRLRPWGILVSLNGPERVFVDVERRADRLDTIRARRAHEALQAALSQPMPDSIQNLREDLRRARQRSQSQTEVELEAARRRLLDRFPVTPLRAAW